MKYDTNGDQIPENLKDFCKNFCADRGSNICPCDFYFDQKYKENTYFNTTNVSHSHIIDK